jgi:hypothetical protein
LDLALQTLNPFREDLQESRERPLDESKLVAASDVSVQLPLEMEKLLADFFASRWKLLWGVSFRLL